MTAAPLRRLRQPLAHSRPASGRNARKPVTPALHPASPFREAHRLALTAPGWSREPVPVIPLKSGTEVQTLHSIGGVGPVAYTGLVVAKQGGGS